MSDQSSNADIFYAAEYEKGLDECHVLRLYLSELYFCVLEETVGLPIAVALSFSTI